MTAKIDPKKHHVVWRNAERAAGFVVEAVSCSCGANPVTEECANASLPSKEQLDTR